MTGAKNKPEAAEVLLPRKVVVDCSTELSEQFGRSAATGRLDREAAPSWNGDGTQAALDDGSGSACSCTFVAGLLIDCYWLRATRNRLLSSQVFPYAIGLLPVRAPESRTGGLETSLHECNLQREFQPA